MKLWLLSSFGITALLWLFWPGVNWWLSDETTRDRMLRKEPWNQSPREPPQGKLGLAKLAHYLSGAAECMRSAFRLLRCAWRCFEVLLRGWAGSFLVPRSVRKAFRRKTGLRVDS